MKVLQTALCTFSMVLPGGMSDNQELLEFTTISFILTTLMFDFEKNHREIKCFSPLTEGLIVE